LPPFFFLRGCRRLGVSSVHRFTGSPVHRSSHFINMAESKPVFCHNFKLSFSCINRRPQKASNRAPLTKKQEEVSSQRNFKKAMSPQTSITKQIKK